MPFTFDSGTGTSTTIVTATTTGGTWTNWVSYSTGTNVTADNIWVNWLPAGGWAPIQVREVRGELDDDGIRRLLDVQFPPAAPVPEDAAKRRARKLLFEHLTKAQRAEYKAHRRFHVRGADGHLYRINHGWAGNVQRIGRDGDEYLITEEFCIHPDRAIPEEDNLLVQKLLLETNPAQFRGIANVTALRRRIDPVPDEIAA